MSKVTFRVGDSHPQQAQTDFPWRLVKKGNMIKAQVFIEGPEGDSHFSGGGWKTILSWGPKEETVHRWGVPNALFPHVRCNQDRYLLTYDESQKGD